MERDEALSILRTAGYALEHVEGDQWRIALAGARYTSAVVREVVLIALAEAIKRSTDRDGHDH